MGQVGFRGWDTLEGPSIRIREWEALSGLSNPELAQHRRAMKKNQDLKVTREGPIPKARGELKSLSRFAVSIRWCCSVSHSRIFQLSSPAQSSLSLQITHQYFKLPFKSILQT